jgi:hypothetical protein
MRGAMWRMGLLLFVVGCQNDETFTTIVREHMKAGPVAACCIAYGGLDPSPACAAEAETKCAYAKDAKATYRVEHRSNNNALVYVDLDGPHGKGSCVFNLGKLGGGKRGGIRIQLGHCNATTP